MLQVGSIWPFWQGMARQNSIRPLVAGERRRETYATICAYISNGRRRGFQVVILAACFPGFSESHDRKIFDMWMACATQ